ncbi:MAG: single-stranded DNA-binding protein, partial [Clostridium sp.]
MNKVFLIGRLTRDPELRFTAGSGNAVATFSLAVDRNYVSQNGQREADF